MFSKFFKEIIQNRLNILVSVQLYELSLAFLHTHTRFHMRLKVRKEGRYHLRFRASTDLALMNSQINATGWNLLQIERENPAKTDSTKLLIFLKLVT